MLKDEVRHFLLSLIAGTVVGWLLGNFLAIPVALLSGFFIDADHLIDYAIYKKFQGFNLSEFLSGKFFDYSGKVYVLFHAFEYVFIFFILGFLFSNLSWLFFSFGLSLLFHLLYDTLYNKPIWPTYFLFFRICKRFDHKTFCFKCER